MARRSEAVEGIAAVAIDCDHPEALARFWQALLGGEVRTDEVADAELHTASVRLDFLRVPDRKVLKNRLHLDLRATHLDDAVQHALASGATSAEDVYEGGSWQVLRDPEGNEFCILRPTTESLRTATT